MHTTAEIALPLYQCHKKVRALKIKEFRRTHTTIDELEKILHEALTGEDIVAAYIVPEDPAYAEFPVSMDYVNKHNPEAGGYYVVYEDGYKSFSPAKAFEDGYTRI